jgi:propionyl-CoA carboxylase alpha chain
VTVRNDTGVYEGGEISIYYDPMIAKLCTHAPDRATAISAMSKALDEFYVDGIQHNIPFVAAIMEHPRWKSGELSTSFIADEFPDGFNGADLSGDARHAMATVAVVCDHTLNERKREISGQMGGRPVKFGAARVVKMGDEWIPAEMQGCEGRMFKAVVDGREAVVESGWTPGEPVWRGRINGRAVAVQVRAIMNGFRLTHAGCEADATVYNEREAELAKLMPIKLPPDTSKQLLCPMPGLVVSIDVEEGQEVKAGEKLAVVEAMKMENILRAERDATVSKVHAEPGANLAVDAIIMEFE